MKKQISVALIAVLLGIFTMTACNDSTSFTTDDSLIAEIANSLLKKNVDVKNLSSEINGQIEAAYFETYPEMASLVSGKGYEVVMGTGELIYFNTSGRMLKGENTYSMCDGKHPRPGMGEGKPGMGEGKPGMGKGKPGMGEGHHGDGIPDGDTVAVADLPATITDYVAANYPDATIQKAKLVKDAYLIKLDAPMVLKFDLNGNFVEELPFGPRPCAADFIDLSTLPAAITDYIAANYPDVEVKHALRKDTDYVVGTLLNGEPLVLIFDQDGNFLAEHVPGKCPKD